MRARFSDRLLQSIKPPPSGERPVELWDELVRGLGFRVGHSGTRSFHVMTRVHGRQVRQVIGPFPAIKLKVAREEAGEIIRQARKGIDPREMRRRAQRDAERAHRDTFAAVVEDFIEKYAKPRNRRWAETERTFKVNVHPIWGKRPIASITRRDVFDLLEKIDKERGPYMSNRTLAAIRRLFAWAVERDVIDASPVANLKPVGKEVSRDRVLTDEELRAFWKATEADDYPWHPFLRTLLLTAQRRSEVAQMRWADVDLEGEKPLWSIPREFTKMDRAHDVPLAPEVAGILAALPRNPGPYVFSTGDGTAPVSGFTLAKRRLDEKMIEIMRMAGVGDDLAPIAMSRWTLHDLRRTGASGFTGVAKPVQRSTVTNSPGCAF